MKLKALVGVLAVAGLAMPGIASATNGYFSHGYGIKAKGMGGAATATASDAMGGANNPASMVFVGDRLDVGIDWFSPKRAASRTGAASAGGSLDMNEASSSNDFLIPEFGYNMMLGEKMSLGITVYGNGGMNTDYQNGSAIPGTGCGGSANVLCGSGSTGVNLEQMIVAPTFAYKVNASNSIGVSPLFVYQRFSAKGLQAFGPLSSDSTKLTNNGHDSSTGWGVRLGWQGKVTDAVTLGATYSPKIDMSKFKRYAGLFAEQGDFDIPMNWNLGVAFKATPAITVALDYQHIDYSGVKAIADSGITAGYAGTTSPLALGGSNGLGFGWSNVNAVKLGVEYKYNDALTLRAGINHGDNPIKSGETTFNILAPGVVTDHYTLGATYGVTKDSEITVSYMHAQEKSVSGPTSPYFGASVSTGTETIKMYQNSLGVAYGMKF
ncbi:long-chain fatty acid transport protein [Sulfuricella denitrificans skB26]|uniref:Long-chain fatty acid transport protein n=1 Tax=Sulfuricella denitrificans (strain DSM 22764 / NBRC 105220 / skB26) TaxID=1163617 RepID=S6B1U9_SULDS|nr:outer membrane protein transport protein [Sulfuricella denitrificans]BAN34647.1 long-chain fatty acid transport protein [Sulfuricella denitrificans skB26]